MSAAAPRGELAQVQRVGLSGMPEYPARNPANASFSVSENAGSITARAADDGMVVMGYLSRETGDRQRSPAANDHLNVRTTSSLHQSSRHLESKAQAEIAPERCSCCRLMRRSPGPCGSEWPDLRVWRSLRCCLDDCKWCAGRAYLDAGEARGCEEFTPFGFGAFLSAHHGEHAQVGDLGQGRQDGREHRAVRAADINDRLDAVERQRRDRGCLEPAGQV